MNAYTCYCRLLAVTLYQLTANNHYGQQQVIVSVSPKQDFSILKLDHNNKRHNNDKFVYKSYSTPTQTGKR